MARLAEVMRITGRVAEALRTIDEALLLLDQDEAYIFNAALLVKADVLADLGLRHLVRDLVEPLLQVAEQSGQFHIHGVALFLLARATYGEGHLTEAADLTKRVLEAWRQTEDNYYGLPMLLFACRLRCEEGALPGARALIVELRAVKHAPTAGAIISAAEARLAMGEGRLDDAVRLWEGSAASFEEAGRPVDACRARLELGRTRNQAGRIRQVTEVRAVD